ncbi:MAG: hypothetical protein EAZ85_09250 [Bacteroidetes bacterium]|nr:MAG: hypothetical protein EAZ85_09250 [Bacteroidota bacterium]TAG88273.1 MAG: hypothetical protein EAZ20_08905 [Bacteroidota bacterium]
MIEKLKKLQSIAQNIGYNVELHTKNKEITQDFLQISFQDNDKNIQSASLMFSPLSQEFENNDIITFYYHLPFANTNISNELLSFVFYVNGRLPIGHINIQNDKIQLRYNYMTSKENSVVEKSFKEILVVFIGEILTQMQIISDFVQKKITLQESFKRIG